MSIDGSPQIYDQKSMNISHRQLKMFVVLAKALNFTHAAKKLFVTQPAISMQIKQLENEIGLPLFEHIGKKMFLTSAGGEILRYAENILAELNELDYAVNELKGIKRGHLRLAVANSLSNLAAKIMGEFLRIHPEINIFLEVGNRQQQLDKLIDNSVDLAIMGQTPKALNVNSDRIMETQIIPVAAPNHPLAQKKSIVLADLKEERFLYGEPGSGTRVAMDGTMAEHFDKSHIEVSNNEMVKYCIQAGIGIGLLPKVAIEMELQYGVLVPLDVEGFPLSYQVNLVHSNDKKLSLVATEFKRIALGLANVET
jgi:DNA-binding transcriptional LysR family regulator